MKHTLWFTPIVIFGLFLLACNTVESAVEPPELHTGETAVAITAPPTETPTPPLPTATLAATENADATPLATNQPPTTSPTPQYTATHTTTPTQIPSPTPTLLAPDHLQVLAAGQTLPISYDLLFISEGELRLWQPQIGRVHNMLTTAANLAIDGWRMTPDKQTILIAQTYGDDTPGFTLSLFDVNTRQLGELWSEADTYLFAYDLAGDGRSAAIITSTTRYGEGGGQETITFIDVEQKQATPLSSCPNRRQKSYENRVVDYTLNCTALVAVPNSDSWLWRDIEGLWQGSLNTTPRLLATHDFFEDSDPPLIYSPTPDWSPNGRYQLLSARRFEGGYRWLLDMETGQTFMVEDSGFGIDPDPIWQWTQDNRLVTVLPPDGDDVFVELWHLEGLQMLQDAALTLPNPNGANIVNLSQLPDGRFAFVINGSDPNLGTISLLPNFNTPPQPLTTLMPLEFWGYGYDQSLTWTPDAAGAVYIYPDSQGLRPFYLPADGAVLYDLTQLLGGHITHLVWLP